MPSAKAKAQKILLNSDDESSDSSSASSSNGSNNKAAGITINQKYAKAYQERKQKEELQNSKHLLEDENDDASSSESSEDEDGVLLTTRLDADIFSTINALRKKDDKIYDPKANFFDSTAAGSREKRGAEKTKPKRYKDLLREQVLEKIDRDEDDASESDVDDNYDATGQRTMMETEKRSHLAYDQEQENLRKQFVASTAAADEDSDSENDLIVVKKGANKGHDDDDKSSDSSEAKKKLEKELKELEKLKQDDLVDPRGEVQDGEQFLLDYFKKRTWVDTRQRLDSDSDSDSDSDDKSENDSDGDSTAKSHNSDASLEQLDKTDDFEAQYNFRFEQAEASAIQSGAELSIARYARGNTMKTLRRKDDSRREKRESRKERKLQERKAKEEQLKRLKNAKRKEMEEKLQQIKMVIGNAEHVDEDALMKMLEGDFDPDKLDALMQQTYDDEYYEKEDSEWKNDVDVKNALKDDEDGDVIVGNDEEGGLYDDVEDDADNDDDGYEGEYEVGVDADDNAEQYEYEQDNEAYNEEEQETEVEKKIKSKIEDELYKLDYEDIVAGMPTRFKYRQVERNSYGLSTAEILSARDTTLKQFVSLKKLAPYREDGEFKVTGRKRKKFRDMLKKDVVDTDAPKQHDNDKGDGVSDKKNDDKQKKSKKKSRRLKKNKDKTKVSEDRADKAKPVEATNEAEGSETKVRDGNEPAELQLTDEMVQKTKKRKRRKKNKAQDGEQSNTADAVEKVDVNEKVSDTTTDKKSNKDDKHKDDDGSGKQKRSSSENGKKPRKKRSKHRHQVEGVTQTRLSAFDM